VGPVFLGFVGGAAFATFPPLVGSARPRHPLRETTTMNRTDLSAIVLELLEKETGESYPGLEEATTLREGLNLDSLDMAGLVLHIENRFGIQIENDLHRGRRARRDRAEGRRQGRPAGGLTGGTAS
jgi:acyl carrier protein